LTRINHFKQKYGSDVQVIVTDDCSGDDTPAVIREKFPWVEVIENGQNRGFAGNVMVGTARAEHPYLAILNSDIDVVGNIFKPLIHALEENAGLFATMPLIFNRALNKVENLARLYCHRGLCWHTELPEEEEWSSVLRDLLNRSTDVKSRLKVLGSGYDPVPSVLCGAAFVCRREEFFALGGFDLRYQPFYWEDVDLDYRARRNGQRCATVLSAAVVHRHSETINRFHSNRKLRYLRLNQLRFVMAHKDQLEELVQPYLWWGARALKETFGDPVLRAAYWRAGIGLKDI
jgi:hypothetical protein